MIESKAENLRIFVDKVFTLNTSRELSEEALRSIKKAGFNMVSNRWHGDNIQKNVIQSRRCAKVGLKFIPWLRGTVPCTNKKNQLVFENGVRLNIAAPLTERFWSIMHSRILANAALSVKHQEIIGVFIDFEIYDKRKYTNAYPISYDDYAWEMYFSEKKLPMPKLPGSKRYEQLKSSGLIDDYSLWYRRIFRKRAEQLRREINRLNPNFRFFVYNGELLVFSEFMPAISSSSAPAVLAMSDTYGPPCPLLGGKDNISICRELFKENRTNYGKMMILAGIDPIVKTCTPEFAAKLAVAASQALDGYWVFYEGFGTDSPLHTKYMRAFTAANKAIKTKNFKYADEVFSTVRTTKAMKIRHGKALPVAVYGGKKYLFKSLSEAGYQPIKLTCLSEDALKPFAAVILQNLNAPSPDDSNLKRILRNYVNSGGSLMLAHDSGWFISRLFDKIAQRSYPEHNVSNIRHVLDPNLIYEGKPYIAEFPDHVIFKPGIAGRVLVKNRFNNAVVVSGCSGKGRMVYAGCYFAYKSVLSGIEKKLFGDLMRFLTASGENRMEKRMKKYKPQRACFSREYRAGDKK